SCSMSVNSAQIHLGDISTTGSLLDHTKVDGQSAQLQGFCNGASSSMTVTANPILGPVTSVTGFTNRVDYTATAALHTAPATNATDTSASAGAGSPTTVGLFSDLIDVTLSASVAAPAGNQLVAGAYTGSVVVTLTPGS